MENQSKEIFLPRKVFLEKTKILDINLRDYLNSCGLPQSLELFSPNQVNYPIAKDDWASCFIVP